MNKKQLAQILKYSNPKEIYVVTWDNRLIKLNCPFKVRVIRQVVNLKMQQELIVTRVKITNNLKTVFIIKGKAYHYCYFDILTPIID